MLREGSRGILLIAATSAGADSHYANRFFSHLPNPTVFHYNAVIRAFSNSKTPIKAVRLFLHMLINGIVPDHLTYPFLVKSCVRAFNANLGACIHGHAFRRGVASDAFVANSLIHMYGACGVVGKGRKVFDEMPLKNLVSWNSMLDGYGKCGDLTTMRKVFDEMPQRDVVSWSALVDGYVKDGNYVEELATFERMIAEGWRPNTVTMVSVLCVCAHLGALNQGRAMHQYAIDNNLPLTLTFNTSLVDMYAKCGAIDDTLAVIRRVSTEKTDVLIWNVMIGGFANHGRTYEALKVYKEMQATRIKPDEITYLCLLSVCTHGELVEDAWRFFSCIKKDVMVPKSECNNPFVNK